MRESAWNMVLAASRLAESLERDGAPRLFVNDAREGLRPALELAIRYAHEQGLLPRPISLGEAWGGSPPGLA